MKTHEITIEGSLFVRTSWTPESSLPRFCFYQGIADFSDLAVIKPLTIIGDLTDDEMKLADALTATRLQQDADKVQAAASARAAELRQRAKDFMRPWYEDPTPAEPNVVDAAGTYQGDASC